MAKSDNENGGELSPLGFGILAPDTQVLPIIDILTTESGQKKILTPRNNPDGSPATVPLDDVPTNAALGVAKFLNHVVVDADTPEKASEIRGILESMGIGFAEVQTPRSKGSHFWIEPAGDFEDESKDDWSTKVDLRIPGSKMLRIVIPGSVYPNVGVYQLVYRNQGGPITQEDLTQMKVELESKPVTQTQKKVVHTEETSFDEDDEEGPQDGGQHPTLTKIVMRMPFHVASLALTDAFVLRFLETWVQQNGHRKPDTNEHERILQWCKDRKSVPVMPFLKGDALVLINKITQVMIDRFWELDLLHEKNYPFDDGGSAELLADLTNGWVLHEATNQRFMFFNGTHHEQDRWNIAFYLMSGPLADIQRIRAAYMINEKNKKRISSYVDRFKTAGGIRGILQLFQVLPRINFTLTEFDTRGTVLNTPGGVVDLINRNVEPHSPWGLFTKCTNHAPKKGDAPKFHKFLDEITLGRKELQDALQRFLGSMLVGTTAKDMFAIFYGSGQNGKTVLLELVNDILGEYAMNADISTFTDNNRGGGHTDDLATLRGARGVITSETNSASKLDEGRVKSFLGGDTLTVSFKHGRTFSYVPIASLVMMTNHKPRIVGRDYGIWRRVRLFPFDYRVTEQKKNLNLKVELLKESPQILSWLCKGASEYLAHGWGKYDIIESETNEYKNSQDIMGKFISECCVLGKDKKVSAKALRETYKDWAENGGYPSLYTQFREALEEHGFTQVKERQGLTWHGVGILDYEGGSF